MAANSKHVSNMYHNTDESSACFNHISILRSPKRENWARTSINVQYFMFKDMSENHKNQAGFIVYVILVFTLTLAKCLIHETRCTELVGKISLDQLILNISSCTYRLGLYILAFSCCICPLVHNFTQCQGFPADFILLLETTLWPSLCSLKAGNVLEVFSKLCWL